jgi:hypothetical protein
MKTKSIDFSKDELDLMYWQLTARKQQFEEDMMFWAEKKDVNEVKRCSNAISKIESLIAKIIN